MIYTILSGGFDPIHVGHLECMKQLSDVTDLLIILNTDQYLLNKKGYIFMSLYERKIILESIKYVKKVIISIDTDDTVVETLKMIREHHPKDRLIFINGGDRTSSNSPEKEICKKLGIEMAFGVGGLHKMQSSSQLVKNIINNYKIA